MAGPTLYFFFSVIGFLGTLLFIVNMLLFRKTGSTILGEHLKPSTDAHKGMKRLTGNRNLVKATVAALLLGLNLANSVVTVTRLGDPGYATILFIVAPLVTLLAFALVIRDVRHKLGIGASDKRD